MDAIREKIIDYLTRNRVSTTEVADCLGKTGAVKSVYPVNKGHYVAGKVKWVYAYDESNWMVHEQLIDVEEKQVIYVENFGCGERAIFGELVSKYLLLYRQCKGIVIDGNMRDAAAIIRENYPIWCKGYNPEGCFNRKPEKSFDEKLLAEHCARFDGAIAVCDDCGVVMIPKENITEDFFERLESIERQEDIWFDRLDHYKENTFEIVCQKKYLQDEDYMKHRKKLMD